MTCPDCTDDLLELFFTKIDSMFQKLVDWFKRNSRLLVCVVYAWLGFELVRDPTIARFLGYYFMAAFTALFFYELGKSRAHAQQEQQQQTRRYSP